MMKKVLLLALVIASYGLSFAQQTIDLPANYKGLPSTDKFSPTRPVSSAKSGGPVNGWYDPDAFIRNNATGPFETFVNLMFPDSTVVNVGQDNVANSVFAHAFGHIYDLRHENWAAVPSDPNNPTMPFAQKDNYTWDSVAFLYLYRRNNADVNVVDTCFIHYYKNSVPNNIDRGSVIFTNGDTMLYATANGLNQKSLSGEAYFKVDTILLGPADTTSFGSTGWGSQFMVRSVNTNIQGTSGNISNNPNSWFGYTVSFKPGHEWSPGDTIESRGLQRPAKGVNYFGYRYTSVTSGVPPTLRSRRYADNSLVLYNITRYGQTTANGWSGFMPGVAFNNAIFVHAQALVSGSSTVSVEELKNRGVALGTSYPNPVASGQKMSIDYANKTAQNITIEIFDLLGKKVSTVVNNEYTEAGEHTATFNVDLHSGIYFYTMTAGDVLVGSKKFTVTR